jgi:chromosome segregation ATPase
MGSLADRVNEMEEECDELEGQVSSLEAEIESLENDLEDVHNELNKLKELEDWLYDTYPDIAKQYECLNDLKEKANGNK